MASTPHRFLRVSCALLLPPASCAAVPGRGGELDALEVDALLVLLVAALAWTALGTWRAASRRAPRAGGDLGPLGEMALAWHEPARLVQIAIETLRRDLHASSVYVLELDPGGRDLRLRAAAGLTGRGFPPVALDAPEASRLRSALTASRSTVSEKEDDPSGESLPAPLRDLGRCRLWAPLRTASGAAFGLVGLHRDAHRPFSPAELQRVEHVAHVLSGSLAHSRSDDARARLASVLEATTDLVGIVDPKGRRTYLNPAGRRLLGLDDAEDISSMTAGDPRPEWARRLVIDEALPAALRDGSWSGETTFLRKDGSEIPVWQVVLAHRNAEGDLDFFSTIARDITDRKKLEEQLRQSQKMEAIGRLAGGIAHDFNNVLTAVLGYADLHASKPTTPDSVRDGLREIERAATRAAALTQQLLAFSRRQVLKPTTMNVNRVVEDMTTMLRMVVGETIQLSVRLEPALGDIRADRTQIEQVILNLVVNARDAMPEGGRLVIETSNAELGRDYAAQHGSVTPGPHVLLAVSDTGSGMDAATRENLFEPFFTTKSLGRGTGLGLSTVYGIVKQSGGNIWVYSEPGLGTTFKIYFPVSLSSEPVVPAEATARESVPGVASAAILLAEDDESVRRLAATVLREAGYAVVEAAEGLSAVALVEAGGENVDLLITDVVMPGMSGAELSERLRARLPALRTLYLSGYTENVVVHHGTLDADVSFLAKPFTGAQLLNRVREVLVEPAA